MGDCSAAEIPLAVYALNQRWSMYALKSLLLTTASLLSINCRVMYQNTANDNFSFKRTCRPYLWPLRVMSAWLMKSVCARMCVCRQTECPRQHRRRGMATDVPSVCLAEGGGVDKVRCMSVCVTQGRWGTALTWSET